jgi:hypothetical protein
MHIYITVPDLSVFAFFSVLISCGSDDDMRADMLMSTHG